MFFFFFAFARSGRPCFELVLLSTFTTFTHAHAQRRNLRWVVYLQSMQATIKACGVTPEPPFVC